MEDRLLGLTKKALDNMERESKRLKISANAVVIKVLEEMYIEPTAEEIRELNNPENIINQILLTTINIDGDMYTAGGCIKRIFQYCDSLMNNPFYQDDSLTKKIAVNMYNKLGEIGIKPDCRATWKNTGDHTKNIRIPVRRIFDNEKIPKNYKDILLNDNNIKTQKSISTYFDGVPKRAIEIDVSNFIKID